MTSTAQDFMTALAEYPDGLLGPTELCLSCVKVLPIDRAAITVGLASDTWELLGASDETSARIEAKQSLTGEGPSVDALTRAGPVLVDDLAKQLAGWPGFTSALGADAKGAMYAFPLQIGAIVVGVLDLYRVEPLSLEPEDMTAMLAVADIVTMVLLSRTPPHEVATDAAEAWWVPSPASSEIHQATGMVVAQLAVPPRIAYLRLRAYAFANDLPLTTVALDVIERRLRFTPDDER
ncbi:MULTISPECIES: GAF and ANTAR domain-containing protein [unclassified Mycobacterium]|uniref:GAF and ANTAR domain-containing protein n=1 Tax=unclassified Mycobacterium TaxID=2642494 RepID=UPI0029C8BC42|nr:MULTISPECIES: GAF and ANTAR domain-containing protein [unclassified Mycobacterium]